MDEESVKKSFQNLKKDIDDIKENLRKISFDIEKKKDNKQKDISGKIFTSKVFVNEDMRNSVDEVFDSGIFTSGEKTKEFERKFADYVGIKHAIAVNNGTVAIELVLRSLGIKKGDEIIVPSHTTMPTIEPILHLEAKPVFVDISEDSYLLDPKEVEKVITKKTKAIIVVHLYGNVADVEGLKNICDKNKIFFIEDCAQAHGSRYNGKHVGTFGIAGCFSFYPTKNLTVCGEGGMITTNDDEVAKKILMLRSHGEEGRYNHLILGGNYRLSEIHSAIGIKQLEMLESFVERRREIAKIYDKEFLQNKKIIIPKESENSKHSYHLYVIRVNKKIRDNIIGEMAKENIFLGIHYPTPTHKQPVIKKIMKIPKLKITEKIVEEIISLPMYPLLEDEEVKMIAEKINNLVGR
jgi:dTDP-4-amino-4,6-dideoxygalactose transaminase